MKFNYSLACVMHPVLTLGADLRCFETRFGRGVDVRNQVSLSVSFVLYLPRDAGGEASRISFTSFCALEDITTSNGSA